MVGCAKDVILKGIVACGGWPAEVRGVVLLNVDLSAEGTEFTEVRGRGRKSRYRSGVRTCDALNMGNGSRDSYRLSIALFVYCMVIRTAGGGF
jgi:hypothetical protein